MVVVWPSAGLHTVALSPYHVLVAGPATQQASRKRHGRQGCWCVASRSPRRGPRHCILVVRVVLVECGLLYLRTASTTDAPLCSKDRAAGGCTPRRAASPGLRDTRQPHSGRGEGWLSMQGPPVALACCAPPTKVAAAAVWASDATPGTVWSKGVDGRARWEGEAHQAQSAPRNLKTASPDALLGWVICA